MNNVIVALGPLETEIMAQGLLTVRQVRFYRLLTMHVRILPGVPFLS
jgi:hypothetical protein